MNCVVCGTELAKEMVATGEYAELGPNEVEPIYEPTGYHICPKCRIVYREKEGE